MPEQLGPTGKFPDGKLSAHDEGELAFAVGEVEGNVVIKFGKEVSWLAMAPEQAVTLAELLIAKARVVARRTGKPLVVRVG
jgi:hypothetical protein